MKYEIFRVNVASDLSRMNELLSDGWELYGFPTAQYVSVSSGCTPTSMSNSSIGSIFQAVVKKKEEGSD